jgi:hypothetical protein
MTVDANNRVVPAVLRGLPQQQADALMMAVAPVMDVLQAQPQVGAGCKLNLGHVS